MAIDSFSAYAAEKVLGHTLRGITYTPPTNVYLALLKGITGDGASVDEVAVGSGYTRQAVTFNAPSNGTSVNSADVTFPAALASWGIITHLGVYDTSTPGSGNLLMWGQLSIAKSVALSAVSKIPAGQLSVTLGGAFSLYLRNALINLFLRNVTFTSPSSVYVGVGTAVSNYNASISEPSGNGYARVGPMTMTSPGDGTTSTAASASFTANGGNWGTVTHLGIYDSLTGGNLLYALAMESSRIMNNYDSLTFASGSVDLSVE